MNTEKRVSDFVPIDYFHIVGDFYCDANGKIICPTLHGLISYLKIIPPDTKWTDENTYLPHGTGKIVWRRITKKRFPKSFPNG